MKYIVLVLFLSAFQVFSQNNYPDGPFKEYYKNGVLGKEGFYKNNKKIGTWKNYSTSGALRSKTLYDSQGNFTGVQELYSEEGVLLKAVTQTEDGALFVKEYYESGELLAEYFSILKPARRTLKSGSYKEYYKSGGIKVESIYVDNELSGIWRQFYETGELEWEVYYSKGYKQGSYKGYYKNGKVKVEGVHDLDEKSKNEKRYDSLGNHINTLKYNKGELKRIVNKIKTNEIDVPDGVLERLPIYPGCEKVLGNTEKKLCMSQSIAKYVVEKFNKTFARDTRLSGNQKINVIFKINKKGNVTAVRAKANHQALEAEAIRVLALLPNITPGTVRGKPVVVPYSLPIIFQIQ